MTNDNKSETNRNYDRRNEEMKKKLRNIYLWLIETKRPHNGIKLFYFFVLA